MADAGLVASEIPTEVVLTEDQQKQKTAEKFRQESSDRPVATTTQPGDPLPEVVLVNSPPEAAPALDKDTLEQYARELHEALHRKQLGFRDDPDEEKVRRLLDPLNAADRAALERTYHDLFDKSGPAGTLRRELQKKLSETDWREAEAMLNRVDGRTNDAGALMVAVTRMKDDPERGNREILAVFRTLNSKQIADLDRDFRKHYGVSYQDYLKSAKSLRDSTKQAITILERGSDRRTVDDVIKLANIAVDSRDREMFAMALSGDLIATREAGKKLYADAEFRKKLVGAFPSGSVAWVPGAPDQLFEAAVDRACIDYLKEGKISLATIADANSGSWIFGNKKNIDLAIESATQDERELFIAGRKLALDKTQNLSDEQKKALQYYLRLHKAFDNAGSEREIAMWEDQLMHGRPTIITQMGLLHSDGLAGFIKEGHNKDELYKVVENLSEEDYHLLRTKEGKQFLQDIEASLKLYATDEERKFIMQMLADKAAKETYEESKTVRRSLQQVIDDNKGNAFLWFGTDYDGADIALAIANMPKADAANYKGNPQYRQQLDQFVTKHLNETEQLAARRLLGRVLETGEPPRLDEIDILLQDKLRNAKSSEYLPHIEAIFAKKDLRERLSLPDDKLTADERKIKELITGMVYSAWPLQIGVGQDPLQHVRPLRELYETGRLSVDSKLLLGYSRSGLIQSAIDAPPEERQRFIELFKPEEAQIITKALANRSGQLELEDLLRLYVVTGDGSYSSFEANLESLTHIEIQKLKDSYFDKYGTVLQDDFLQKIRNPVDRQKFENLFTPADEDGRQDFYENYHRMLESRSGFSPDGSPLTLERATQLHACALELYQSYLKKLPPDQQKAMTEFFGAAFKQYQDSKEKLAEVLVDATITAAALGSALFTGGMSTSALIAMIGGASVAGAAYRVAAFKVIQGNDFDASPENILKQIVAGGTSAALNFIGPELFFGVGKIMGNVADNATIAIISKTSAGTLKEGAQAVLATELKAFMSKGVSSLSEDEALGIARKIIADSAMQGSDAELRVLASTVRSLYAKTFADADKAAIAALKDPTFTDRAKALGIRAAQDGAVGAISNVASDVITAPMMDGSVDWESLMQGALLGFAVGSVVPIGIAGLSGGTQLVVNVAKKADGWYVDPAQLSAPATFRNVKTGETRHFTPGQGQPLKLTNDWQVMGYTPPQQPGRQPEAPVHPDPDPDWPITLPPGQISAIPDVPSVPAVQPSWPPKDPDAQLILSDETGQLWSTRRGLLLERADGTLVETDNTLGITRTFSKEGRIVAATRRDGAELKYIYDWNGRPSEVRIAHNGKTTVLKSEKSYLHGNEIDNWFDFTDGVKKPITVPDETGADKVVTSLRIDQDGDLYLYHADLSGERRRLGGGTEKFPPIKVDTKEDFRTIWIGDKPYRLEGRRGEDPGQAPFWFYGAEKRVVTVDGIPLQPGQTLTIGRSTEANVRVDHPTVSRNHATMRMGDDGALYITDNGSSNGTFINGERLQPGVERKISAQDIVRLGDKRLPLGQTKPSYGAVKVHVNTYSVGDLAELQRLLIPALNEDPLLQQLVQDWKTFDPRHIVGQEAIGTVTGIGNRGKAFTVYARNAEEARAIQKRIDEILMEHRLELATPIATGNVDKVFGQSNRVGITRDSWLPARSREPQSKEYLDSGAILDNELATRMRAKFGLQPGQMLSVDQLRKLEELCGIHSGTLSYSTNNELILRVSTRSKLEADSIYLDETGAIKTPGQLTDRPAMYALYRYFGLEPTDFVP